ncbi:MAG: aromatic compounds catabolism protein [Rhodospirillaceae bacterium]|nr:aromatic compounds catabolism protein [Rhodospirillaceae bacterium]
MADDRFWDPIAEERESGLQRLLGYRIVAWEDGFAAVCLDLKPHHMNRSGVLHGGVVATMLDAVGGLTGLYCPVPGHVRKAVSISLNINFVGQARDQTVRAEARKIGGGRKIFFARGECLAADGSLIATAEGSYRYRSGSEDSAGIPRED